jgi:hypothetical protein
MRAIRIWSLLAVAAGLATVACSDSAVPTETTPGSAPTFSAASDAAHARHEALKQELEARKAEFKARKAADKQEFEAAREEWKAWKRDWNAQYRAQREAWKREHPESKGEPQIELLRCEPKEFDADAAIVGPSGGTLHAGAHELIIPKGALDHEELITMEAPTSSLVDVRFEPHGLQFQQEASLKLSYKGCVRPTTADLLVAYLSQGNQILELPPSIDRKSSDEVEAEIGHFSRYAVAY